MVKVKKMKHKELIKESECGGLCEPTGRIFSCDVSWSIYKCLTCGKELQVVNPGHQWNTECEPTES